MTLGADSSPASDPRTPAWYELVGRIVVESSRVEFHVARLISYLEHGFVSQWADHSRQVTVEADKALRKHPDRGPEGVIARSIADARSALSRRHELMHRPALYGGTRLIPETTKERNLTPNQRPRYGEPVPTLEELRRLLTDLADAAMAVMGALTVAAYDPLVQQAHQRRWKETRTRPPE